MIVKSDLKCRLLGTVKVHNLGFEKSVQIRTSDNNWTSYLDKETNYSSSADPGHPYETFAFDFEIPHDDDEHPRLEFCVRFRCNGQEFWDNNDGKNFALISQNAPQVWTPEELKPQADNAAAPAGRCRHPHENYAVNCENWGSLTSWQQLECQGPYW